VSAAGTPVVSAIGHEPDTPLLDHVADLRCSTPTDAGKRIVPDLREETQRVRQMRDRGRRALHGWVDTQTRLLTQLRSRPSLADPLGPVQRRQDDVDVHRERARRATLTLLAKDQAEIASARARLTALGPAATLARGYAVVQFLDSEGNLQVLRSVSEVEAGAQLRVRVGDGAIGAVAEGEQG
jgi:exodeoxyribonuclease VII large subunit